MICIAFLPTQLIKSQSKKTELEVSVSRQENSLNQLKFSLGEKFNQLLKAKQTSAEVCCSMQTNSNQSIRSCFENSQNVLLLDGPVTSELASYKYAYQSNLAGHKGQRIVLQFNPLLYHLEAVYKHLKRNFHRFQPGSYFELGPVWSERSAAGRHCSPSGRSRTSA